MPSHRRLFPSPMSEEEYQREWDALRAVVDQLLHDPPGSHIVSFEEMHRNESETSFIRSWLSVNRLHTTVPAV